MIPKGSNYIYNTYGSEEKKPSKKDGRKGSTVVVSRMPTATSSKLKETLEGRETPLSDLAEGEGKDPKDKAISHDPPEGLSPMGGGRTVSRPPEGLSFMGGGGASHPPEGTRKSKSSSSSGSISSDVEDNNDESDNNVDENEIGNERDDIEGKRSHFIDFHPSGSSGNDSRRGSKSNLEELRKRHKYVSNLEDSGSDSDDDDLEDEPSEQEAGGVGYKVRKELEENKTVKKPFEKGINIAIFIAVLTGVGLLLGYSIIRAFMGSGIEQKAENENKEKLLGSPGNNPLQEQIDDLQAERAIRQQSERGLPQRSQGRGDDLSGLFSPKSNDSTTARSANENLENSNRNAERDEKVSNSSSNQGAKGNESIAPPPTLVAAPSTAATPVPPPPPIVAVPPPQRVEIDY